MIFLYRMILIFLLSLSVSCSSSSYGGAAFLPKDYHSSVSGVFLDGVKENLCEMPISLIEEKPLDIMNYAWRKRNRAYFLLTGIQSEPVTRILIASPELCDPNKIDPLKKRLRNEFDVLGFGQIKNFQKRDTDALLKSFNLWDIDLDFTYIDPDCAVIRDKQLDLGIHDPLEIRYTLALPILYYSFAGGKELLVFDSQCEKKEIFTKIIDNFYGS